MGTLILLAAGLVIYNILKISVSKRIKGYGTLRAIGGEKGQLYQIIVIEVILLCLMGIPIGMLPECQRNFRGSDRLGFP